MVRNDSLWSNVVFWKRNDFFTKNDWIKFETSPAENMCYVGVKGLIQMVFSNGDAKTSH